MARVSELLLLAAPSCGGKTRFLNRVFAGHDRGLLARMGVAGPIQSYERVLARELPEYAAACVPRMALHVCLPVVPLAEGTLARIADVPMFDFVRTCARVTSITLVAGSDVLQSRLRSRHRRTHRLLLKNIPEYLSERKRLAKLIPIYEDPANLVLAYEAWLQYIESLPNTVDSWLITSQDEYQLHKPAAWPGIRESYFGSSVSGELNSSDQKEHACRGIRKLPGQPYSS